MGPGAPGRPGILDRVKVGAARAAAANWVAGHAAGAAWFRGAFFSGSTVGLPDGAELALGSDVDVMVVTAREEPPPKPGKLLHRGALLEVTSLPWRLLASAEQVLASYHLAGSFRVDTLVADPTGHLRRLQERVARGFAERAWVRRRCEDARRRVSDRLRALDPSAPFHDQVTAWLFPTGVTTHVVLVAALRNPTVRLRYLAAREALADHGHAELYPELLALLGCAGWTQSRAERHLRQLARAFDAAAAVAATPFFFSGDVTELARPVAIDASRRLIDGGRHREAVFWMVATSARCQKILAADAPLRVRREHAPAFEAMVADLGITSTADLGRRADEVIGFLPRLWRTAEAIMPAGRDAAPRS